MVNYLEREDGRAREKDTRGSQPVCIISLSYKTVGSLPRPPLFFGLVCERTDSLSTVFRATPLLLTNKNMFIYRQN